MRLFAAIDIPDHVEHNLARLLERLRPIAKISWSTADRLHITTKFIGEWPDDRLEEIKNTLASAGSPGAISISVRNIGWFPSSQNPRVLWTGIEGGEPLRILAHATEEAVHSIGVPKEDRDFSPHLTLARIRECVPLDALRAELDRAAPFEFGDFVASAFRLYSSKAGHYTRLADFPLT